MSSLDWEVANVTKIYAIDNAVVVQLRGNFHRAVPAINKLGIYPRWSEHAQCVSCKHCAGKRICDLTNMVNT